jgi:hypothetical protein
MYREFSITSAAACTGFIQVTTATSSLPLRDWRRQIVAVVRAGF